MEIKCQEECIKKVFGIFLIITFTSDDFLHLKYFKQIEKRVFKSRFLFYKKIILSTIWETFSYKNKKKTIIVHKRLNKNFIISNPVQIVFLLIKTD